MSLKVRKSELKSSKESHLHVADLAAGLAAALEPGARVRGALGLGEVAGGIAGRGQQVNRQCRAELGHLGEALAGQRSGLVAEIVHGDAALAAGLVERRPDGHAARGRGGVQVGLPAQPQAQRRQQRAARAIDTEPQLRREGCNEQRRGAHV